MGRGVNQVGSALKDCIEELLAKDPNIQMIILYSDSCVGQNKNFGMLGLLHSLACHHHVQIEHIFPIRGHSYMPPDRAFGRVEKLLSRRETILLPEEYMEQIRKVGQVKEFGKDWHTYAIKEAVESYVKRPAPFRITDAKKLTVSHATPMVTVSLHYTAPGTSYNVLKRGGGGGGGGWGNGLRCALRRCIHTAV